MLCTTQPVWDAFWNKLQPQQRFNDETSDVHVGFSSRSSGTALRWWSTSICRPWAVRTRCSA